jgi:hypothetical protein
VHHAKIAGGAPELLADVRALGSSTYTLAVDDEHVYAAVNGESTLLLAIPKHGGAPSVLVSGASSSYIGNVALEGDRVYFTESDHENGGGRVASVPKAGGEVVVLAQLPCFQRGLAVDADHVYVTIQLDAFCSGSSGLFRVAKADGKVEEIGSGSVGRTVLVDDAYVYWAPSTIRPRTRIERILEAGRDADRPQRGRSRWRRRHGAGW